MRSTVQALGRKVGRWWRNFSLVYLLAARGVEAIPEALRIVRAEKDLSAAVRWNHAWQVICKAATKRPREGMSKGNTSETKIGLWSRAMLWLTPWRTTLGAFLLFTGLLALAVLTPVSTYSSKSPDAPIGALLAIAGVLGGLLGLLVVAIVFAAEFHGRQASGRPISVGYLLIQLGAYPFVLFPLSVIAAHLIIAVIGYTWCPSAPFVMLWMDLFIVPGTVVGLGAMAARTFSTVSKDFYVGILMGLLCHEYARTLRTQPTSRKFKKKVQSFLWMIPQLADDGRLDHFERVMQVCGRLLKLSADARAGVGSISDGLGPMLERNPLQRTHGILLAKDDIPKAQSYTHFLFDSLEGALGREDFGQAKVLIQLLDTFHEDVLNHPSALRSLPLRFEKRLNRMVRLVFLHSHNTPDNTRLTQAESCLHLAIRFLRNAIDANQRDYSVKLYKSLLTGFGGLQDYDYCLKDDDCGSRERLWMLKLYSVVLIAGWAIYRALRCKPRDQMTAALGLLSHALQSLKQNNLLLRAWEAMETPRQGSIIDKGVFIGEDLMNGPGEPYVFEDDWILRGLIALLISDVGRDTLELESKLNSPIKNVVESNTLERLFVDIRDCAPVREVLAKGVSNGDLESRKKQVIALLGFDYWNKQPKGSS